MEKSKSFSGYSAAYRELYDAGSGFEDRSKSYSFNGPSNNGGQDTPGNPELKRRRRVALCNMYTVEDKLKSSLRSSFKWIKNKFINDLYE